MPSANNPYAAPQAAVADIDDANPGVQPVKIFSAKGRMGRLRYLAYNLFGYVLLIVFALIVGGLAALGGAARNDNTAAFLALIPYVVLVGMWTVQRSHDMNRSGWTALVALIPIVNLIWVIRAGTKGANRFGAPPPPNGLFIKIVGLCLPVVAIVGIVAAMALPAYQGYVMRAKANQVMKP
jgi:uncharacterized membrane protein YhaH (DUF805 family)